MYLSEQEWLKVIKCMEKIHTEMQYPFDKHSKSLITDNIKSISIYKKSVQ